MWFITTILNSQNYNIFRKTVLLDASQNLHYVFRNLFFMDNGFP